MSTENIKELDKVLDVGGELFNINAVRATQVDNKLVIKESSSEPDTYSDVEFDGSQAQEVAVVSADKGGYFNNPIGVPDTDVENITVENDGSTVLNYKAVSELIPLLTGSGWYTWGNSSLTALVNNQGITQHFGIVVGSRNDVVSFAGLNHKESTTEITWNKLPRFLYICTDNGDLFYGDTESSTPIQLAHDAISSASATTAEGADKLNKASKLRVALDTTANTGYVEFDGSAGAGNTVKSVDLGVSGTLAVANGGTGQTNLDNVTVGKAKALNTSRNIQTDLSKTTAASFNGSAAITPGVTGTLGVANGGTGQTSLSSVTVGKAEAVKTTFKSSSSATAVNKYPVITVSPSEPSSPSVGDIWIKF